MLPLCADQGVAVIPWSPLARGRLARSPGDQPASRRDASDTFTPHLYDDAEPEILDAVGEVAAAHGASRAQVALAWLLHQPTVTAPIVGATKLAHLQEAIGALELELDDHQTRELEAPYRPRPVLGHTVPRSR